jgi:hypothetical protein
MLASTAAIAREAIELKRAVAKLVREGRALVGIV